VAHRRLGILFGFAVLPHTSAFFVVTTIFIVLIEAMCSLGTYPNTASLFVGLHLVTARNMATSLGGRRKESVVSDALLLVVACKV
jgi:hypothetical protein